jgi:hypothetical protein
MKSILLNQFKNFALVLLISVLAITIVKAQSDTTTKKEKVVKLTYSTNINGNIKTVDTTFTFPDEMSDDEIGQLVEAHMNRLNGEEADRDFDFHFFPGTDFKGIWSTPDGEPAEWLAQMEAWKMQDSSLKRQMEALRQQMPNTEDFANFSEHFNMTDFNVPCPPPCRVYKHHGNRHRHGAKEADCHVYMFGNAESESGEGPENFFYYEGDVDDADKMDRDVVIVKGKGDTIVLKGKKRILVGGEPFEFENFENSNMDFDLQIDSIGDSVQVRVQVPKALKAPRVKVIGKQLKAPFGNNYFAANAFAGNARIKDLNAEDIQQMKGTALKATKKYQLLGVEQLRVESLEPGLIALSFHLEDANNIEIQLFDQSGELLHHEIIKKFSGEYYKEISLEPSDRLYLKISQGGKSLIKKVLL